MLRRRTENVLPDLPDKIEQDVKIDLGESQRQTYDRAESEGIVELNAHGESITVFHVFQLITKLRQICNFDPVTGESAKLDQLLDDLEEIAESGRKTLVFSQFVGEDFGLKRLSKNLPAEYRPMQLHGEVSPSARAETVRRFQNDDAVKALLLNFKVGGVGLNLQAANYVYLFDRWWNPAVEDQAVKRAHRLGQKTVVFVRRFVCRNTIEERIRKKLAEKRRLFHHVIDEGRPDESMGLTEDEIFSLFNLTVRPRKPTPPSGPVKLVLENMDSRQFEIMAADL